MSLGVIDGAVEENLEEIAVTQEPATLKLTSDVQGSQKEDTAT